MAKFLANVNVPIEVVEAARQAGHDMAVDSGIVCWCQRRCDDAVLAASLTERRVLLTFDKDFGEMVFRQGKNASCGVILLRPTIRDPDYVARFALATIGQEVAWEGHFAVAEEGKMRVVPLPAGPKSKTAKLKMRKK